MKFFFRGLFKMILFVLLIPVFVILIVIDAITLMGGSTDEGMFSKMASFFDK